MKNKKIGIIGAGIFGCSIALELCKDGHEVTIIEQDSDIMLRATKNNHNRIHYGYHYPRSLDTANQSLNGLLSFMSNYGDAILYGFENYYSIAKDNSLTSSSQFIEFCNLAGISFKSAYPDKHIMNPEMLSDSFLVEEPVYDWVKLQSIVKSRLNKSDIKVKLNTAYTNLSETFDFIINCTYSNINSICKIAGLQEMSFHSQDVIIPIFESNIQRVGLTVMDGPFCSVMPKGFEEGKFLLYHAQYSVVEEKIGSPLDFNSSVERSIKIILNDAQKYFPFLKDSNVIDYWRTTRAIPENNDDGRVSEILTYEENPNFITVFSGKVTTAVKIAKQIRIGLQTGDFNSNISI